MFTAKQAREQVDHVGIGIPADRPTALEVVPDNIPNQLQSAGKWVCWGFSVKNGRWTKVPRMVDGRAASSTEATTWTTFGRVVSAYRAGGFDGIGFVLDGVPVTPGGLVVAGVDLDHVTSSQANRDRARRLITEFGAYAEWSPSGRGVRIFCLARPLQAGLNRGGVELYTSGRYLTVTGHRLEARDV